MNACKPAGRRPLSGRRARNLPEARHPGTGACSDERVEGLERLTARNPDVRWWLVC